MNYNSYKKTVLVLGASFIPLYFLGFALVAQFIPPHAPAMSAADLVDLFEINQHQILLGMLICIIVSPLYLLWSTVIFIEMRKVEGDYPALSYFQLINGTLLVLFLMLSPMIWATIAYRTDFSAETVRAINDFAWISWIISWPVLFFQQLAIGMLGLISKHAALLFPRWLSYLSIWAAISLIPAGAIIFVKSGPFSWAGLFGLYFPLAVYVAWFACLTKAIYDQIDNSKS